MDVSTLSSSLPYFSFHALLHRGLFYERAIKEHFLPAALSFLHWLTGKRVKWKVNQKVFISSSGAGKWLTLGQPVKCYEDIVEFSQEM